MTFTDVNSNADDDSQPTWLRSGRCGSGSCVEVLLGETIMVRDSKQTATLGEAQPTIELDHKAWAGIIDEIRQSDSPTGNDNLAIEHHDDGSVTFHSPTSNSKLEYDVQEWIAFSAGVRAGEFDLVLASR